MQLSLCVWAKLLAPLPGHRYIPSGLMRCRSSQLSYWSDHLPLSVQIRARQSLLRRSFPSTNSPPSYLDLLLFHPPRSSLTPVPHLTSFAPFIPSLRSHPLTTPSALSIPSKCPCLIRCIAMISPLAFVHGPLYFLIVQSAQHWSVRTKCLDPSVWSLRNHTDLNEHHTTLSLNRLHTCHPPARHCLSQVLSFSLFPSNK